MVTFKFFLSSDVLVEFLLEAGDTDIHVFLYNVHRGLECAMDNNAVAVSPLINATASANGGYTVDERLHRLSRVKLDVPLEDLGITIVMLAFARYYSMNQYPVMVNSLRSVRELEYVEQFLQTYTIASIKIPINLATHEKYGLLANRARFANGRAALTVLEYRTVVAMMKVPGIDPDEFVSLVARYHPRIVEAFYMFTSITKDCKVIAECRELSIARRFAYTFEKPVKSIKYDGDYWFQVPVRSVWFAHHQGRWTFQSYVGREIDDKLRRSLSNVPGIVIGFVSDGHVYPIAIEHPLYTGNWTRAIALFQQRGLNVALVGGPLPVGRPKNIYYVKNRIHALYKLYFVPGKK